MAECRSASFEACTSREQEFSEENKMAVRLLVFTMAFLAGALAFPWPLDLATDGESDEPIDLTSLGEGMYGTPKDSSGDNLSKWNPEASKSNPEEVGEYTQGDILFPPNSKRNGMRSESYRWPNGVVPYAIEGNFAAKDLDLIKKVIADYHRLTCIRFVAYKPGVHKDYVAVVNRHSGCFSSVGRVGGRQELNLQSPGCLTIKGTPIHEFAHAVGFLHEQSRSERDNYVNVFFQNVKSGEAHNFDKAKAENTNDFGVPYDYNSVMHYSEFAFSNNGKPTIQSKSGGTKLGQRDGFSRGDVQKINRMYKCKNTEPANGWKDDVWVGSR